MYFVKRTTEDDFCTPGALLSGDDKLCDTLERLPTGDHPRIAAGTYHFYRFNSPHNGDVWRTDDVEGRTAIEFHSANKASQLLGCIAVGSGYGVLDGETAVEASKATLARLHMTLPDEFDCTFVDPE